MVWSGMRGTGGAGLLLAVTVGGGMLLAGCGSGGQSVGGSVPVAVDSGASAVSSTATTQATTSPAAPPGATDGQPNGQPTSHPGGGGTQGDGNCTASDLAVSLTPGQDNGMSHRSLNIVFTNKDSRTCTLYGYPGVSFVSGPNGSQVGKAADRSQQGGGTVTLTPGKSTTSALRVAQTGVYPADQCRPVQVAGLRVYAPGDTAWSFVSEPQTACSGSTDTQLEVDVVR